MSRRRRGPAARYSGGRGLAAQNPAPAATQSAPNTSMMPSGGQAVGNPYSRPLVSPTTGDVRPKVDPTAALLQTDPGYLAAQGSSERTRGLADQQYQFTTGNLASDYGFAADGSIDPNNPYSRAALLRDSYGQARAGNTTSYAGQGQLYSGALQNAQDESTRQYNIGYDSLSKQYQAGVGQAGLNRLGSYGQADDTLTTALSAALSRIAQGGSS